MPRSLPSGSASHTCGGLDDGMGVLRTPFCEPHVTNVQLLQILLKYIRDNQEKAHLRTAELYLAAMEKAFPCTKK